MGEDDIPTTTSESGSFAAGTPEFDVALSYLVTDRELATELANLLKKELTVFFLPRISETFIATDERARLLSPFISGSRIVVVFYNNGWGATDWTREEEKAIKQRSHDGDWGKLIFVQLPGAAALPDWLPQGFCPVLYEKGRSEILAKIIAAQARSYGVNGASMELLAPTKEDTDWFSRRRQLHKNAEWIRNTICPSVGRIVRRAAELAAARAKQVSPFIRVGADELSFVVTNGFYGVEIGWKQGHPNNLGTDSTLYIQEFRGNALVPGEGGICGAVPEIIRETHFSLKDADESATSWQRGPTPEVMTENSLSEEAVAAFFALLGR